MRLWLWTKELHSCEEIASSYYVPFGGVLVELFIDVCLVVILAGVELSGNYNVLTQISSLSFEIYNSRSVNRIVLQYTSNLIHCIYMTTDLLT